MSEEQAFLHAIAEDPADDAHRLIFADWLEDHGQADRAAFIRAQMRAASLPEDDPARDAAEDEADDLLAEHEAKWLGDVKEWALEWEWRRGGIEHVTVKGDVLLAHGEELFAQAPTRSLRLLAEKADMPRLAECGCLEHVESLDLSTGRFTRSVFPGIWHRDGPLMALLASPHLIRLSRLNLAGQGIEGPVIQTLISSGLLGRLFQLDLTGNAAVGDRAMRTLASAGAVRLERLLVDWTNLTAASIRTLLNAPQLSRLHDLDFGEIGRLLPQGTIPEAIAQESALLGRLTSLIGTGKSLNESDLLPLVKAMQAERFKSLSLVNVGLEKEQLEPLAASPNLTGLRSLVIGETNLRDSLARAIAGSPYLGRLTYLNLSNNEIGGPGIRALMKAPTLAGLRELNLAGNHVGTAGVDIITSTDHPRRLEYLVLHSCNLDAESAVLLACSPALSRLRGLNLGHNRLGDDGVKALANSPHLRHLRMLNLDNNGIDSSGVEALVNSPYLKRLVQLRMMRNESISDRERELLRSRFGPGVKF